MNLEDRITGLEDEFKILKNEIQSVLLNVQEQVLNHHFDDFYEDTPPRAKAAPANVEAAEVEAGPPQGESPQPQGPAVPEEAPRHQAEVPQSVYAASPPPSSARVHGHLDVATVVGLAKWVNDTVKDIGRRSTSEVVEIYDMAGHLAPEVKEVLLRFVSLNGSEELQEKVEMRNLVIAMLKLDRILGRKADAAAVLSLFVAKEE